jgi:hypothetical protein
VDKEGKLTEQEKQLIADWLATRWPTAQQSCPICNDSLWLISDHLVMPVPLGPGNAIRLLGGIGYPQVMLISAKCGYTRYFNFPMMGLNFEEQKSPESKPEEPATSGEKK